jgi:hypothetical protein
VCRIASTEHCASEDYSARIESAVPASHGLPASSRSEFDRSDRAIPEATGTAVKGKEETEQIQGVSRYGIVSRNPDLFAIPS